MPKLNIDQFDEAPKVGDKVKVMGKVKSINEDSGEVDVSYDDVSIVGKNTHKKDNSNNKDNYNNYNNDMNSPDMQMNPNSQTLDQALSQTFPNTQ